MTVNPEETQAMVARATERVRAGWMPPRTGEPLSTQLTDDTPPLTTGIVGAYLAFYAWLWSREPPPEEVREVTEHIRADAQTAWARNDYTVRRGVLARCALWEEIGERPEDEQSQIRAFLSEGIPPGSYPELVLGQDSAEVGQDSAEGYLEQDRARHDAVMQALRVQFQSRPPI